MTIEAGLEERARVERPGVRQRGKEDERNREIKAATDHMLHERDGGE